MPQVFCVYHLFKRFGKAFVFNDTSAIVVRGAAFDEKGVYFVIVFKKITTLAVLALGVVGLAQAGTYSPAVCTSHAVTVPCEDTAWDIGFEAFWVEATNSDQVYAYADFDTKGFSTPRFNYFTIDPNYEFGFQIEASYHFGTGSDITVSWERTHDETHESAVSDFDKINAIPGMVVYGAPLDMTGTPVASAAFSESHGHLDYQFDAVNVEFGQYIDVGNNMDLRIHAGMQYARIDLAKKVTEGADNSDLYHIWESDFDGVGARVGADGAVQLGSGFSAVSHFAVALLASDIQSHYKAIDRTNPTTHERFTCDIEHDSVVVPTLMFKSGINYSADFYGGTLSVEGGWRYEGYYEAVRLNSTVVGGAFTFDVIGPGRGAGDANENFTFHGPYVAVKYIS